MNSRKMKHETKVGFVIYLTAAGLAALIGATIYGTYLAIASYNIVEQADN